MKFLFLIAVIAIAGLNANASGLVRVECESRRGGKMTLFHLGFPHTVGGLKVAYGNAVPHEPQGPTSMEDTDLLTEDPSGGLRFILRGLFSGSGGASYPTPHFEVLVQVFGGQYVTYDTGSCVVY